MTSTNQKSNYGALPSASRTVHQDEEHHQQERQQEFIARQKINKECTGDDDDDDDDDDDETLQKELLSKVSQWELPYDPDKAYRAKVLKFTSFSRPHMRTFHGSWICFFMAWFVWFSMVPLLPHIQQGFIDSNKSINVITDNDIWISNMWSMVGTIFLRIVLGPLCDQFGARGMLTLLLAICASILGLSGLLVHDYQSLIIVRFCIGCVGGTLVPAQYWVTSHFVRDVCGMAMALGAGWGAMGGGIAQVVMGTWIYPYLLQATNNDSDLSWRLAVLVPSILALWTAYFFYFYADDCPLGNYKDVQRAGLMQERSAIDSFRSGIFNLNAWFLFLQFAASLGIELTMESAATSHLAERFDLNVADAAAYASLFGIMNIFSRGFGGWLSDVMHKNFSLRGRLIIHMTFMIMEGVWIFAFIDYATSLYGTMLAMIVFAIFGQMSMGTCFGIVPYVDGPNTGTIAGIVGAGGNVGAIFFLNTFRNYGNITAFHVMAVFSILMACITPLIVIKGYQGILFGKERQSLNSMQIQHRNTPTNPTLMTPLVLI